MATSRIAQWRPGLSRTSGSALVSGELEVAIPALSDDADCGTSLLGALGSDPDVVKTSLDPLPLGRNQLLGEIGDRWRDEHRLREPEEGDGQ